MALVATLAVVITALAAAGATAYAALTQVDPSTVPTGNLVANNQVSTVLTIGVGHDTEHALPDGSEVFIRHVTFPAGGSTGWHTHLGPVFVMVVSGSLTLYDGQDTGCTGVTYSAGQGFIDPGFGHIHLARNEGTVPGNFYATYILPPDAGNTLAIPAAGPAGCIVPTPTTVATAGPTATVAPAPTPAPVPEGNLVANNRVSTALTIGVGQDTAHSLPNGSEVFIRHVVLPAGGSTGWHTHLGPVVVNVVSGSLTLYDGHDASCTGVSYAAGHGFVDPGFGHNHLARNEGTGPAEFYATYILPPDAGDTLAVPATGPAGCIVPTPAPTAAAVLPTTGTGGGSSSVMTWPVAFVALGLAGATVAAFVARRRVGG